ncbi:serine hydrolase [Patescibacteria group bacterium]|nr:serine hydrolase [Patescibacteria group bacterium]MBU4162163.1 serine hydrolase [Patescibacteria group bacterium]
MNLETWYPKAKFKFNLPKTKNIVAGGLLLASISGSIALGKIANEYLYWKKTKDIYTAAVVSAPVDYSFLKPFRNWKTGELEGLKAKSAISLVTDSGSPRMIFDKSPDEIMPIASLTKLLTAYIVLQNYELDQEVVISQRAVDTEEIIGGFWVGEKFTVDQLLHSILIESSNDAARALAEIMGEQQFVNLMNKKVKEIGLKYTHFIDPIGLDPDFFGGGYNYSTANDLAMMVRHILQEADTNPEIARIFEITRNPKYPITLANGRVHHEAISTNKLLSEFPNTFGAKTGQTPIAGQCLLVIMPQPKNGGHVINIVLGSSDRFKDMENIINWINTAFVW